MKKKPKMPVRKGHVKVPVIMQFEATECGAACLAMVLSYYEKWVPLAILRSACDIGRDGTKDSNIVKAACHYGLKAQNSCFETEELQKRGQFPCIIHWNSNHFVVLCGFKGKKVVINDPKQGVCRISIEQFEKSFTGECLFFEPDQGFVAMGKKKSTLSFAKKRMIGAEEAIIFVFLTSFILALLGVLNPVFSRIFMDRILTKANPEWFYPFLIGLSLLTAVTLLVAWVQAIYMVKLQGKMAIVANTTFLWHILRLPRLLKKFPK